MENQDAGISNEAAALVDVLNWSADLPAWQRDALRRLCSQPKLDTTEIAALAAYAKARRSLRRWMPATSVILAPATPMSA